MVIRISFEVSTAVSTAGYEAAVTKPKYNASMSPYIYSISVEVDVTDFLYVITLDNEIVINEEGTYIIAES